MAELHVQKKKHSNTLWIVIGILLVALIAWMATFGDDETNRTQTMEGTTTGELPVMSAPTTNSVFLIT